MQTSGKKSWTRWKAEHRQGQNTLNASSAVRLLYTGSYSRVKANQRQQTTQDDQRK